MILAGGAAVFRLKLLVRTVVAMAVIGAVLFGFAGRIDLPFFWAYLSIFTAFALAVVLTVPEDLLQERFKPGEGGRDSLKVLRVAAFAVFSSILIIAGLDVGRFHWSDTVPVTLRVAGLAAVAVFLGVWYWAMRANPFFSAAVRIQRDRGHYVVSSGPYRFVRHPGYAAFALLGWGGGLALGSWWAAAPHLALMGLFVRRAALEDRMLREELQGYADYAKSVRYRFIPGVW